MSCTAANAGEPMDDAIRVYIVADFEPLRIGLADIISSGDSLRLVGQASSLEEMAADQGYRRADVLVVDMHTLNKANRDAMYQRLQEWVPDIKALFLGSAAEGAEITFETIPQAVHLHTFGFILKDGPADRLLRAIRLVASGAFVCETDVIKRILTRLTQWADYQQSGQTGQLSPRETEVLTMVAQGRANKEIARELFLSEGTVKVHISHIMAKLGLGRRTELVRYALTKGVISLAEE